MDLLLNLSHTEWTYTHTLEKACHFRNSPLLSTKSSSVWRILRCALLKVISNPFVNDALIALTSSLGRSFPNSTGMCRSRWRTFASGEIHSLPSIASRWTSSLSSLPTSPPRRTVSMLLPFAVVGVDLSLNTAYCGLSCSSERVKSTCRPSSIAPKGSHWTSLPIMRPLTAP